VHAYQKEFIQLALSHQVLKFGQFTLKSGRNSPYFFNMGLFNRGQSLSLLGEYYLQTIQHARIDFTQLFGPAYKGIPLVSSVAIAYARLAATDLPYSFNRKEAKAHGEGGLIVGAPLSGRVLIIDDVMTAGTAVREAIQWVADAGAQLAGIVVALDRQEKGLGSLSAVQEIQQHYQVPVESIINLENLIDYMREDKQFSQTVLSDLLLYREQYGV